ncbi:KTSC domain-containing protein [Luteibacter aegosomaticola]|uniref:KTSC domain-containing protein n=1 Tax=Luteibacter aegosomaticola TaxID=2911538 RepID=UPI001FFB88B3|nr:KTSC domain-containing protein [Luteibacter aegosomaticola]UPG88211.1 KTSC domain-containing protein [Luteibacter aegosomaticola]
MLRESVQSSVLASVGYDPDHQILEIEFLSGTVYRYWHVEPLLHVRLMQASSKGRFFDAVIRDARPFKQVS